MDKKHKVIINNILCLLVISLAVVFIFKDIIVNKKIILGGDSTLANYPSHTVYAEELKQFKIALWNPYLGIGFPSLAEPVNSTFHPLNLVCFFFFPLAIAMTVSLILCILFSGIFMYLYARKVNMSYSASIFCAFAFALGTNFTGHFSGMEAFVKVIMFLPLIFYGIENMLVSLNIKNIVFLSIFLALAILGGHSQAVFYSLLALGLYIIFNVFFCNLTIKNKFILLSGFAFAFLISLGLSAIQLIPTFELKSISIRSGSIDATSGPMYIAWLKYLIKPTKAAPFCIGVLPFIFSPLGILKIKKDKRILFYLLLLLFFFVLSFGKQFLPLYLCKCLDHLPGFNYFRYCHRYIYISIFFIVLLSGEGLDFLIGVISKIKRYRYIQLGIKYFIAILIPTLLFINLHRANEVTANGPPNSHNNYDKLRYSDYLSVGEGSLLMLLKQLQQENELMKVITDFSYDPDHHLPENLLSQFKIPSFCINGGVYSSLNFRSIQGLVDRVFHEKSYEILDSLGINYFVKCNETPPSDSWELIFRSVDYDFNLITEPWFSSDSEIFVFKNKKAFPGIFMVSNVDDSLIGPEKLKDASLNYNIDVVKYLSSKVTLKTTQNKNAYLVINNAYCPGWEAYIDGEESKIYLANVACRAILVPKGEHFIEFKYNPFSYRIGKYITLLTIFVIFFCAVYTRFRF